MLALFGFSLTVDASTLMTGVGFGAGAVGALAALFGLYRLARASSNLPKRAVVEATGWLLMSASVAVAFVGVAAWYQAVPDNKGYLPLEAALPMTWVPILPFIYGSTLVQRAWESEKK